jgi:hypothetical protein
MSNLRIFSQKQLTHEDQLRFAAISGDRNPVHVDPVFARRTQFGRQIVHGMHLVLWTLDGYFASFPQRVPSALNVRFLKPAFIGDALVAGVAEESAQHLRLEVVASGATLATLALSFDGAPRAMHDSFTSGGGPSASPRDIDIVDVGGREGCLPFGPELREGMRDFPAAARVLGPNVVAALVATSRVVGMECPGLHSLYAGLAVVLDRSEGQASGLAWRVAKVDPRIRKVDLQVSGGGVSGRLETFFRTPPVRPLPMDEVRSAVAPGEFAGHRPLIVGGSRGLGEATAKIVAAGGGDPVITYASGRSEAERVAAEIRAAGGRCTVMPYDVRHPAAPQLAPLPALPTSFYYFATCAIFQRKSTLYDPALMREFLAYFVDGFHALCSELRARQAGTLVGFYPSTVAIDEPVRDLAEYCLAKQAGEALCTHLARFTQDVRFVVRRLPRVVTDQTATILAVASKPALDVMVPIVRDVHAVCTDSVTKAPTGGAA